MIKNIATVDCAVNIPDSVVIVADKLIGAMVATGKTRARISFKTIETCNGGQRATVRFLNKLMFECEQRRYPLIELERGGFTMISASALEGAACLIIPDETKV